MRASVTSRTWTVVAIVELVLALFAGREILRGPDGNARLEVLSVGQGDSLLLTSPSGKQILIDGGPDAAVLQRLGEELPLLDRTLELVVLTHPDADHLNGLVDVLKRYQVKQVMLAGTPKDSARYAEFLSLVRRRRIAVLPPDPDKDIHMGDGLVLDVVWPRPGEEKFAVNDMAIVLRVFHGSTSVLLTGDIEKKAEEAILKSGADLDADILKLAHHGSKTSTMTGFLLAVTPRLALVSTGEGNSYGHPHSQVMDRLERYGIPVRDTAREGTIEIEF